VIIGVYSQNGHKKTLMSLLIGTMRSRQFFVHATLFVSVKNVNGISRSNYFLIARMMWMYLVKLQKLTMMSGWRRALVVVEKNNLFLLFVDVIFANISKNRFLVWRSDDIEFVSRIF